jgi:hypothetical protein
MKPDQRTELGERWWAIAIAVLLALGALQLFM